MGGNHNSGRKAKYLTVERFEKFLSNDWYHLQQRVKNNTKLLWLILGGLIVAALIERLL